MSQGCLPNLNRRPLCGINPLRELRIVLLTVECLLIFVVLLEGVQHTRFCRGSPCSIQSAPSLLEPFRASVSPATRMALKGRGPYHAMERRPAKLSALPLSSYTTAYISGRRRLWSIWTHFNSDL